MKTEPFVLIGCDNEDTCNKSILQNLTNDIKVKKISGKNCHSKAELFQEFSKVFKFPDYFGMNWDAFEESLTDLSWMPEGQYVLQINNFNELLEDSQKDFSIFIKILKDAINADDSKNTVASDKKSKLIKVIFNCGLKYIDKCRESLEKENIQLVEGRL